MTEAEKTFTEGLSKLMVIYYRNSHIEATRRGIQAAKARKKLRTKRKLACKE